MILFGPMKTETSQEVCNHFSGEFKYRSLFLNMKEGVFYCQVIRDSTGEISDWKMVDANPTALSAWGMELPQVLGKSINQIFGEGTREKYLVTVRQMFAVTSSDVFEEHFPKLDKFYRFSSFVDGDCFFTIASDITEAKKIQARLDERTRLLETILEQMPFAVIVGEAPTGKLVFANRRMNQVWRHPLIHSSNIDEYGDWVGFHKDGRRYKGEDWPLARAIAKGEIIINEDTDVLFGDGTRGVLRLTAAPIRDNEGKILAGVVLCEDVTERIQSETKLKQTMAIVEAIMSTSTDVIFVKDLHSRMIYCNRATLALIGKSAEEVMGKTDIEFLGPGGGGEEIMKNDQQVMGTGETQTHEEVVVRGSQTHIFQSKKTPLHDGQGQVIGLVGISREITDQKRFEQDLKAAKEVAESANKMKSAFLANMSHEIRTPLGAILGFSDLLMDSGLDTKEKETYQAIIKRNGEQLTTLIGDILDLSKIEAGQLKIEPVVFEIRDLTREIYFQFNAKAHAKGLDFSIEVNSDVSEQVKADVTRLRQILVNIIGNAIKFTDHGFVRMHVMEEDGVLIFFVRDSGIGIPPEQAQKLFKPFSQADESITRRFGGTGLGLTLSKRLALALGGDLTLRSSGADSGSVFEVRIKNEMNCKEKGPTYATVAGRPENPPNKSLLH